MADFAKLLEVLGRDPSERISVCTVTDQFRPIVTTVGEAPDVAGALAETDCWYGANPLHDRVPAAGSKGFMRDVVGICEVYADLDVKPGGMPDYDAAQAAIVDLAGMLGEYPAAIVSSGHGLQPHWPIERDEDTDWPDETDPRWRRVVVLNRRWHRLVAHVCEVRGGGLDNVSNLDRILRVPGTTNRKAEPVPVTVEFTGGAPVTLEQLAETLDEYGVPELPGDDEVLGDVVSEPGSWSWVERTCPYVAAMVEAWNTDAPAARHPWLVSQAVRLAAAHRAGCLTRADHGRAVEALTARFRALVGPGTAPRPGGKTGEQRGEVSDALAWGRDKVATFLDTARCREELGGHVHLDIPAATTITEDDRAGEFWQARPVLRHLHAFARARMVAPWGMLGVVLVRAVCVVQPNIMLPPTIGSRASLNLFCGLVGPVGTGKSVVKAAARDAIDFGDRVIEDFPIGTGEGIAATYMRYEKRRDEPPELVQHRFRALFHADEIGGVTAIAGRNGATLLPVLRSVYSGETIGNQNADVHRRLPVARHSYRAGLIVGIQPTHAGVLLDDADAGTPQRFTWMPTVDPRAPAPDGDAPPRMHMEIPLAMRGEHGALEITVCDTATTAIREAHLVRLRGEPVNGLDGHALQTRLKVATGLGILDGRLTVTDEDWQLAETVMRVSDRARGWCVQALADKAKQTNRGRAEAEAERTVIIGDAVDDAAAQRVARAIRRKLGAEWIARNELRTRIAARDRGHVDDAIERLIEAGQVEVEQQGQWTRYRLAERADS